MNKRICIVEAGRTFSSLAKRRGDFIDWVAEGLNVPLAELMVVTAFSRTSLPEVSKPAAVVVTGSHAMVTERRPWSERLAAWLAEVVVGGVPVLGICYGHQLLAHALGGTVGDHPGGGEFGSVDIQLAPETEDDPLFGGMPAIFPAQVFHRQSVSVLPPGARSLARSKDEPHQAVRFAPRVWGLQFHPEFDAEIMAAYLDLDQQRLILAGHNLELLKAGLAQSSAAASLLGRFRDLAFESETQENIQSEWASNSLKPLNS